MKKILVFALLSITLIFGIVNLAMAAGAVCTASFNESYLAYNDNIIEVDVNCLSDDTNGAVPVITIPFKGPYTATGFNNFHERFTLAGRTIYSLESIPVTQPVTGYTISIGNSDVTAIWAITARSTTANEIAYPTVPPALRGPVTITTGTPGNAERLIFKILFKKVQ